MLEDTYKTENFWIKHLGLTPHPEGGHFKEVFRSKQEIFRSDENKKRDACTSIYYLLEGSDFSGFHRLKSEEIWYFHKGSAILIHIINESGGYSYIELSDLPSGQLQAVVESNCWFAAEIPSKSGFSLVSCAVAPGFDFAEFEMADRQHLLKLYPEQEMVINKWCRV